MHEDDGRKLDHVTLEAMRIRAVKHIEAGAHPVEVARARGTVYGWVAKYRQGGPGALRAKPIAGRPPKLTGQQIRRVYTLVVGVDPRQLQFDFALWTREMVRDLIRREFGVALSVVSVGRLLKKLGLSAQRPLYRAYQQNPEAVEEFTTCTYPTLRAQAEAEGATIYFTDEADIRSDYHGGTTWAPIGQTPVAKTTGAHHGINMISAITAKGALRFAVYQGALTAAVFIDFLKRLLHDAPRPIYLVVDGHPAYRARVMKEFVASTNGRLRLVFLPAYAPELNPDKGVWTNIKHDRIARTSVASAADLKAKALGALRRLQKMPHIIRAFFSDPHLAYINA